MYSSNNTYRCRTLNVFSPIVPHKKEDNLMSKTPGQQRTTEKSFRRHCLSLSWHFRFLNVSRPKAFELSHKLFKEREVYLYCALCLITKKCRSRTKKKNLAANGKFQYVLATCKFPPIIRLDSDIGTFVRTIKFNFKC